MIEGPFNELVLKSLTEFDVPVRLERLSDKVGTFALHVCEGNVKDTMDSLLMTVIRAVHGSCSDDRARIDAIRALKVKTESLFLQYADLMQYDEKDPFISFAADLSPIICEMVRKEGT